MAYLGRGIENLSDRVVLDSLTASATASYTLQLNSVNFVPSSSSSLTVSLNGVIQKPDSSYTVSGSSIVFASALTSSDSIDFIIAERGITLQTPSAGSVGTSQLASNAVTAAKINDGEITNAKISSTAGIATSKLGTGAVLQVVRQGQTQGFITTSTSYSDVISKAITPISSSSTILVRFQTRVYMPTLGMEHEVKLLRDSTELEVYRGAWHTGTGSTARREIWEYFDGSHGTTSSITYKFQQKSGSSGSSVQINPNGAADGIYYLTLMEIAG